MMRPTVLAVLMSAAIPFMAARPDEAASRLTLERDCQ